MDIELLEQYTQRKGIDITNILIGIYDSSDFQLNSGQIEKEIYDIALSYAKIFFFEAKSFVSEGIRNEMKLHIRTRFVVKEKEVEKMKDIDLFAHWIKLEVIESLSDQGIILL